MSLDPSLAAQLVSTVYVASLSSVSSAGDPTWGTPAAVSARVEQKPKRVVSTTGEEVVSEAQLITETEVPIDARVWLPGLDQTDAKLARVPKAVHKAFDVAGGDSHWETYL